MARQHVFHFCLIVIYFTRNVTTEAGWFWHVSDFHYDPSFFGERISCAGPNATDRGMFGSRYCDPPWALVKASVDAMNALKPNIDFILWTGDSVAHGGQEQLNLTINDEIIGNISELMNDTFRGVPVYPSIGNNDQWPDDQFPPNNNAIYNLTLARWRSWIDLDQDEHYLKGGYYSKTVATGLSMVVLNTNIYYQSNKALNGEPDPSGQLTWLENVLASANTRQEKVIISGHVAPGLDSHPAQRQRMHDVYNTKINGILDRYGNVISSMHFGHDHSDAFRVFSNNEGNPTISIFNAPAVTPWQWYEGDGKYGPAHNPAIRLVKYDKTTGETLEILQYYLDLDAANQRNATAVSDWYLSYTAPADYRLPDLNPPSLYQLASRMRKNKTDWYNYMYFKWNLNATAEDVNGFCDEDCRRNMLCGLTEFDTSDLKTCKASFDAPPSHARQLTPFSGVVLTAVFAVGTVLWSRNILSSI